MMDYEFQYMITFMREEIAGLQRLARWRSDPKVERSAKNYKNSAEFSSAREKSYQAHYLGIAGEYGVAKYLGAFFDPIPRMKGDGHCPDIIWGGEAKIAVKTTKHEPPIFKINSLKEIQQATDLALCVYNAPILKIVWIKNKEEFLEKKYTRNFNFGTAICLG